jgi:hypothetical protein
LKLFRNLEKEAPMPTGELSEGYIEEVGCDVRIKK